MKPTRCRVMCPDCGREKMQFETEKEAERFIQYNGAEISDTPEELRVYYCPACCCYHISSKPGRARYKLNTSKLMDAYYEQNGEKEEVIERLKETLMLVPKIKIPATGIRKITNFAVYKNLGMIQAKNELHEKYALNELLYWDLVAILKKVVYAHMKKIENREKNAKNHEKASKKRNLRDKQ